MRGATGTRGVWMKCRDGTGRCWEGLGDTGEELKVNQSGLGELEPMRCSGMCWGH